MKKFHELNESQKKEAIEYANSELRELISIGLISVGDKKPTDQELNEYAELAAETALYSEPTDHIVADIA